MRKWIGRVTCFLVGMSFFLGNAYAEKDEQITLKKEKYNSGIIVRTYEDDKGNVYEDNIDIPYSLRQLVEAQYETPEERLYEAKKQMYTSYYLLGLKERMKALNNERAWNPIMVPKGRIKVDESLQAQFKKEQEEFYQYAQQKKIEWDILTPEQKNKIYDPLQAEFRDFKPGTSTIIPYTVKEAIKANGGVNPDEMTEEEYHKIMAPNSISLTEKKSLWIWAGIVGLVGVIGMIVWHKRKG